MKRLFTRLAFGLAVISLTSCGGDDNKPKSNDFTERVAGRWWAEDRDSSCNNRFLYFALDGSLYFVYAFTGAGGAPGCGCDDLPRYGTWQETEDGYIAKFYRSDPSTAVDVWRWKIIDLGAGGKQLELYDEGEGGSLDYTLYSIDSLPVSIRAACCTSGECP